VVCAENEADAWAAFADGSIDAQRHPKAHERKIVPVESLRVEREVAKPKVEDKPARRAK
jgi:hypothetical protein